MSERAAPEALTGAAILHPTDFSETSGVAFAHALKIAIGLRARLYILHIDRSEPEKIDWDAFPSVRGTLTRWQLLEPGSPPEAVMDKLGVGIRKVDVVGRDPVTAIVDFFADHPAELIVLATRGRDTIQRWLRGEVAEPLARKVRAPVLFLPEQARAMVDPGSGSVRLEKILVPIARTPSPEAAVGSALWLTRVLGVSNAAFELLHVGTENEAPSVQVPDELEGRLEVITRPGAVVDAIVQAAADQTVGLIAMASEGHREFLDAWRGSTTEQVVRRAPCPVLAVPAG